MSGSIDTAVGSYGILAVGAGGNVTVSTTNNVTTNVGIGAVSATGVSITIFYSSGISINGTSGVSPPYLTRLPAFFSGNQVPVDFNFTLTFNEAITAGTGSIVFKRYDGSTYRTIAVTDSSQVSFSGNTLTINPAANLPVDGQFTVTIPTSAVVDLAGNHLQAGVDFFFDTYSMHRLTSSSVDKNPQNVPTSADVTLVFDGTIHAGSGNIELRRVSDNSVLTTIPINDVNQVHISGDTITINPNADLPSATALTVVFPVGTLLDSTSASIYGGPLTFTTAPPPDTASPLLINASPVNGQTSVSPLSNITLTFDEKVRAGSGDIEIRKLSDGSLFEAIPVNDPNQVRYDYSGQIVTIDPQYDLAPGTAYYVNFRPGVFLDLSANDFGGLIYPGALSFTTFGSPDTTAPTLSSLYPKNASVNAGIGANLYLTFNEKVKPVGGNIEIHNADGSLFKAIPINDASQVRFDLAAPDVLAAGQTITIDPNVDLLPGKSYYVTLGKGVVEDLAGNDFAGFTSSSTFAFTTAPGTDPFFTERLGISEDFTIGPGDTFSYQSDGAYQDDAFIVLSASPDRLHPAFVNNGTINAVSQVDNQSLFGVAMGDSALFNRFENNGTLTVSANATSAAIGFGEGLLFGDFINGPTGLISATANIAYGAFLVDSSHPVENDGRIVATGAANAIGIEFENAFWKITNTGTISAEASAGPANALLFLFTGPDLVHNTGSIVATSLNGSATGGIVFGSGAHPKIVNDGTISATDAILESSTVNTSTSIIENHGTITGRITLTGGTDILTNTGTITGDIDLGGENDVLNGRLGTINGTAHGGNGNDYLRTGLGNDAIFGDSGNDTLNGGAGADTLTGGPGGDVFMVSSVADISGTDVIADFDPSTDKIDLGRISGLVFIGTAGFSGSPGQVRYTTGGGRTTIQIDSDGNGTADGAVQIGNGEFALTSAILADVVAPRLESVSPADQARNVPANASIVLTFDEPVKAGSGSIGIRGNFNTATTIAATDTSQVQFSGNTVTIHPAIDLAYSSLGSTGETFTVSLGTGAVQDLSGNAFDWTGNSYQFVVQPKEDQRAYLDRISPVLGHTGVPVDSNIVLTFTANVQAGTASFQIRKFDDNSLVSTISAADATQVSIADKTITINPAANLDPGTHYYVVFEPGAIKDFLGFDPYGIQTFYEFTTASGVPDLTAPLLLGTSIDGNAFLPPDGTLTLTFNEPVKGGTGLVHVATIGGDNVLTITGNTGNFASISGNTVTLHLSSSSGPLARDTQYYVTIAPGAFSDVAGNAFAGITSTETLAFTTVPYSDNGPSNDEQYMLELLNDARLNPAGDWSRYITSFSPLFSSHPGVEFILKVFNVSGTELQKQLAALTPAPPLAWNEFLTDSARDHSLAMLAADMQAHQTPGENSLFERVTDAGYTGALSVGENVFAYSSDVLYGQAGFIIDWGTDADGIQSPPGHRINIMDPEFRDVGIGIFQDHDPTNDVGPSLVTEDFGTSATAPIITGVAYNDKDHDNFYSPGEGLNTLTVSVGAQSVTSFASGGYNLSPGASGPTVVNFTGAGITDTISVAVDLTDGDNVKIDIVDGIGVETSASAVVTGAVSRIVGLGITGLTLQTVGARAHTLVGTPGADHLIGGVGSDMLLGGDGADVLDGGPSNDTLDGGAQIDTAVYPGLRSDYTIEHHGWDTLIFGPNGNDALRNIEWLSFADGMLQLPRGEGATIDLAHANPANYMGAIRDFGGNDLGGASGWTLIGQTDVQNDGDPEYIYVNRQIGRWATVGPATDGKIYFDNYAWGGDTRVVGTYIDPLVGAGIVIKGSAFDSQKRFENDLLIDNINKVLSTGDFDHDGLQEIYFGLTDKTAYLHAYMHADGNIRYANYQSQDQVIDYLSSHGYHAADWSGWLY